MDAEALVSDGKHVFFKWIVEKAGDRKDGYIYDTRMAVAEATWKTYKSPKKGTVRILGMGKGGS